MITYTIHGFNVKDFGSRTIDKLIPFLENSGHTVLELDYPWHGRVRTRLCNASMAKILSQVVEPHSIIFGHSNGCAIIYLMAELGVKFSYVGLINPALDRNKTIQNALQVVTYYAENDLATRLAKWVPWSPWGDQGRVGYCGDNPAHENRHLGSVGHSGVFQRPDLLKRIAKAVPLSLVRTNAALMPYLSE